MHPIAQRELEDAREAIAALCRRYGVRRLWIFGSATGEGFDPARSDYDFLAEYGGPAEQMGGWRRVLGLPEELAELLGRPVDVLGPNRLENPFFRRGFEASRRELYAA